MEIRQLDDVIISDNAPLRVTIAGGVIDVMQMERQSRPPDIIWSDDRSEYTIVATGEVRQAKHRTNRTDDKSAIDELKKTMRRMRQLINANWCGDDNELMITLTYAENMTDPKRLKKDMEKWLKKAKRRLGEIKYLYVVEPQARGAWHSHCLIKQLSAHSTYWPAEDVADAWGHGFVRVQRITGVDNVGAYLSAYMSNAPDAEDGDTLTGNSDSVTGAENKAVIKGKRAAMYPRGMHLYRASKNLAQPITKKIRPTSAEYRALINGAEQRYARSIALYEQGGADGQQSPTYINRITQLQYVRNTKGGEHND